METRTFTCSCKKTVEITHQGSGGYNVGEVRDKTGWNPVFTMDGGTFWLCPDCTKRGKELANELLKIVGTKDFHFGSFVSRN